MGDVLIFQVEKIFENFVEFCGRCPIVVAEKDNKDKHTLISGG